MIFSDRFSEQIRNNYKVLQTVIPDAEMFHLITDIPDILTGTEKIFLTLNQIFWARFWTGDNLRNLMIRQEVPGKTQESRGERNDKMNGEIRWNPVFHDRMILIKSDPKMYHTIFHKKMDYTALEKIRLQYESFVETLSRSPYGKLTEHWFSRETELGVKPLNLLALTEFAEKRQVNREVWNYEFNGKTRWNPDFQENILWLKSGKEMFYAISGKEMIHAKMFHIISHKKVFQRDYDKVRLQHKNFVESPRLIQYGKYIKHWFSSETEMRKNSLNLLAVTEFAEKKRENRDVWNDKTNGKIQLNPVLYKRTFLIKYGKEMFQRISDKNIFHTKADTNMFHIISYKKVFERDYGKHTKHWFSRETEKRVNSLFYKRMILIKSGEEMLHIISDNGLLRTAYEKIRLLYRNFLETPILYGKLTEHWFSGETELQVKPLNYIALTEFAEKRQKNREIWNGKTNEKGQLNSVLYKSMMCLKSGREMLHIKVPIQFGKHTEHWHFGETKLVYNLILRKGLTEKKQADREVWNDEKNKKNQIDHVLREWMLCTKSDKIVSQISFGNKMFHIISHNKMIQAGCKKVGLQYKKFVETSSRSLFGRMKEDWYSRENLIMTLQKGICQEVRQEFHPVPGNVIQESPVFEEKNELYNYLNKVNRNNREIAFAIENKNSMEETLYQDKSDIRIRNMLSLADENTRTLLKEVMAYPKKGGGDKFSITETDPGGFNHFLHKMTEVEEVLHRKEESLEDSFQLVHKTQEVRTVSKFHETEIMEKVKMERERTDRESHKRLLTNMEEMIRDKMEVVSDRVYRDLERKFKSDQRRRGY